MRDCLGPDVVLRVVVFGRPERQVAADAGDQVRQQDPEVGAQRRLAERRPLGRSELALLG